MWSAIVPIETVTGASIGEPEFPEVTRPVLPASLRAEALANTHIWGQSSNETAPDTVAIWFRPLNASTLNDVQQMRGVSRVVRASDDTLTGTMLSGLRQVRSTRVDQARKDWIDTYRVPAIAAEDAERVRQAAIIGGRILAFLGISAFMQWAGMLPDDLNIAVTWAALASDTFNRSDRALNGDTMSDGTGVWNACHSSSAYPAIITNAAGMGGSPGSHHVTVDGTPAAFGTQAAEITYKVAATLGPVTRHDEVDLASNTKSHYMAWANGDYAIYQAGHASFTLLAGPTAQSRTTGDVTRLESIGNDHEMFHNGSSIIGPTTDSNHTTGVPGFRVFSPASQVEDWDSYEEMAAGSAVKLMMVM